MENYTKYRLKHEDELETILEDKNHLFFVACNKCFKEFKSFKEKDCDVLKKFAAEHGKKVVGSISVNFLCNKKRTEKQLQNIVPKKAKHICIISCGIGVQTAADILNRQVCAVCDSIPDTGHHGMALTTKNCDACAQCYLNLTGGICPVIDCSKGLLNGQCGGSKNGKCEVDPTKDCAWEKIYQKLEKQGRLREFLAQPVQFRDYSKINYKVISEYVKSIREKRFEGCYGGVHPSERKEFTEHLPLQRFPEQERVVIPLCQHVGVPAEPIVQVGDYVKVGQKIAEASDVFISSPVHSSVSGRVTAIENRPHPTKGEGIAIEICSDGKNTIHESVQPKDELEKYTSSEIIQIIREAGITGMGGAGFPTAVKLTPAMPVDTVLINGCECEPLLTADHRVLLEYPEDVLFGLKTILRATGAKKGYVVIQDNKQDAIEILQKLTADIENIDVVAVKTKYPQGAEKILIKRVLGRTVPYGGLPAQAGVIVNNVSTMKAVADVFQKGMPLIERVVTVSGERIKTPGNYIVKIGTSMKALIDHCGGLTSDNVSVKNGGPMMGTVLHELDVPVIKGSNGVVAVDTIYTKAQPCIRCGRCVDVCPMELSPLNLARYADLGNWRGMMDEKLRDCVECRCCEYICSSRIPIVEKIRMGKKVTMEMK